MDSTEPLQQTIRRCTAVLVAVLGLGFWRLPGERQVVPLLLTVGAVVYLLWSFELLPVAEEPTDAR